MNKISVAAIGMNPVDRKLLKSLFLLSDQNQYGFELVEGESAQLVVADIDGLDDTALQSFKNTHPGQPVLHISVNGGYRPGADPHITKPLKVNVVFEELNKLTESGSRASPVKPVKPAVAAKAAAATKKVASVSKTADSDAPIFNPDDYLVGVIEKVVSGKADSIISLSDQGRIVISPSAGVYISTISHDDLQDASRLSASVFTVTPASSTDIASMKQDDARRSIEELKWITAYYASEGRLPQHSLRNDVIKLDHWPNLTRLPVSDNAISICALLSRYPTSITLATRILKLKPEEMYSFYSAAKLSGAARATNRTVNAEQGPDIQGPKVSKGLLGKLFNKVKGL